MAPKIQPTDSSSNQPENILTIAPAWTNPATGQTYVHEDLKLQAPAWDIPDHIAPFSGKESFGDVESWSEFVLRFSGDPGPLVTWSERGLRAILDYGTFDKPARRGVVALHDFTRSFQWNRWALLANGEARSQKFVLERLEDYAEDIVDPIPTDLLAVLRTLRATASATADTELLANGSTKVVWTKQSGVGPKNADLTLPSEFVIQIPVLKGHQALMPKLDVDGDPIVDPAKSPVLTLRPVLYSLAVRVRVSVDDSAHLAIRLSMPNAERVLESVFADRVAAAQALLGDGYPLYRAAER